MSSSTTAQLIISLIDKVSGPAKQAASALQGVGKAAETLASSANAKGVDNLTASVKKAAEAAKGMQKGFQADWSKGFSAEIDKLALSAKKLDEVKRSWKDLLASLQSAGKVRPNDFLPALDAWEKKTLAGLKKVQREAERTGRSTSRLTSGAQWAAGALGVGGSAYAANRVGRASVRAAADYGREGARNYLAGMTPAEIAESKVLAGKYSAQFPSLDQAQIQERIRNMRSFAGSLEAAKPLLEDHLRALVVLQSIKGRERSMDEMQSFMKGLDVLGKNDDPKSIAGLTNAYVKALGVDSDLDMGAFASFARRSKAAGASLSNEFLGAVVPTFLQDMGGPQLGTALGTEVAAMIGGRATKESKSFQKSVGLRDKKGRVVDEKLLGSNPYEWARKYVPDAMRRAKMNPEDEQDVMKFMTRNFSDQTVANLFTKFITQASQVERNKALYGNAPGMEQAASALPGKDPYVAWQGLLSQLTNLVATAADPLVPAATAALNGLAAAIAAISKAAADNPVVAGTATGVGVAAAAGGATWLGAKTLQQAWRFIRGGAPGAGGAGAPAAETAGAAAASASRFGAVASRFLGPLGAVLGAAGGANEVYDTYHKETGTLGDRLRRQRGGKTVRETLREAFEEERQRQSIGWGQGPAPYSTPDPWPDKPVPDRSGDAGSAGAKTGEAYKQSLMRQLDELEALVNTRINGLIQKMSFTASPTISPTVSPKIAPAPAGTRVTDGTYTDFYSSRA
ncbi:hypothetical protein PQJ75_00610 [Rhodoplanes sp. TEM]|uniref:Phage tail tape measure protein domain-containing protein n=1 Tax=Rhodoplanes tepidamans TaxID=200616 RepID=A0ABT5J530_RHOTP|nr:MULTISPECIES: hypothetical protein [Rhodoplanes]MDC7784753.1 hypothetical protein [Rhodoplanes tepidamans]MDC7982220.1 hypothetical protein [Rhodoplanes sp. TEM]MDQ0356226.1 hypothetical protein [Rhodoplanes tepidamans]